MSASYSNFAFYPLSGAGRHTPSATFRPVPGTLVPFPFVRLAITPGFNGPRSFDHREAEPKWTSHAAPAAHSIPSTTRIASCKFTHNIRTILLPAFAGELTSGRYAGSFATKCSPGRSSRFYPADIAARRASGASRPPAIAPDAASARRTFRASKSTAPHQPELRKMRGFVCLAEEMQR